MKFGSKWTSNGSEVRRTQVRGFPEGRTSRTRGARGADAIVEKVPEAGTKALKRPNRPFSRAPILGFQAISTGHSEW